MTDAYNRLVQELSKRLSDPDDVKLLEDLVSSLSTEGPDDAQKRLKDMIKKLSGES